MNEAPSSRGRRDGDRSTGLLGLVGVGVVVCCGLPLLLGRGIVIGSAGLALGSSALVAGGVVLGVWAGGDVSARTTARPRTAKAS